MVHAGKFAIAHLLCKAQGCLSFLKALIIDLKGSSEYYVVCCTVGGAQS